MPKVVFKPEGGSFDVAPNTKILVAANRNKVAIRYGCASCRCGTCGVKVSGGTLTPMRADEHQLLQTMNLPISGDVRLACQARIIDGEVEVDLAFQDSYSPA